jgi:heterodisulfide reductase subunit A
MVAVSQHPHIKMYPYSEIEAVKGYIGNFSVTIRQKAKYVDWDKCNGCGTCETKCPSKKNIDEFNVGLGTRTAIHKIFPQSVPNKPIIDAKGCRMLTKGKCGTCAKNCTNQAINFEDKDELVTEEVGAILMATGFDQFDWASKYGEYGYGKFPDVITGLEFERMMNASGPTGGKIKRPSDHEIPQSVAFIKCVGSRDDTKGKSYCSRACCMYTAKHAQQVKDKIPDSESYVFYMDVRCAGKGYEEFYQRALNKGVKYIRGRVSKIYPRGKKLVLKSEDTLLGQQIEVEVDMVVLATAMVPAQGSGELAKMVGFSTDKDGFYQEAHPKLQPVETFTGGVYLAGCCQGPKDIPDTVAQAGAAAVKVCGLFSKPELETQPMISEVNTKRCSGCALCAPICPYQAISMTTMQDRGFGGKFARQVASVNEALCQGCGACVAACRSGALNLKGYTDEELVAEVDSLCL